MRESREGLGPRLVRFGVSRTGPFRGEATPTSGRGSACAYRLSPELGERMASALVSVTWLRQQMVNGLKNNIRILDGDQ